MTSSENTNRPGSESTASTNRRAIGAINNTPGGPVMTASVKRHKHLGLFTVQLLLRPWRVVALAPSSRALGDQMAAEVDLHGAVVELGAGTGKITESILAAGVDESRLVLLEMNETFCKLLRERFPRATVLSWNAQRTGEIALKDVRTVVSGLPLLSMPIAVQNNIVGGAFKLLEPGGAYVQFTYGPKPPVAAQVREALGLTWEKRPKIWMNLPPACSYVFRKPG